MEVVLYIIAVLSALLMIVTVLLQSSNAKGLGAIAGEVTANMNKKQAATVETKLALATKVSAGIFVLAALLMLIFPA